VTLEAEIAKIREIANRIGVAGRAAPILGELDSTAVTLDTHQALLMVLAALESTDRRLRRLEGSAAVLGRPWPPGNESQPGQPEQTMWVSTFR
jgi:hypothetical protein